MSIDKKKYLYSDLLTYFKTGWQRRTDFILSRRYVRKMFSVDDDLLRYA